MSALPGAIGRYQLVAELGRGGFGAVFRARDPASGREVAIKVLFAGAAAPPSARARFAREAQALARLRHPNIVAVHDAGEVDGAPFLVMDLVEGEGLDGRLRRGGPLDPLEAARVTLAVARALGHAHRVGVLHRDVKPPNVLLPADGGEPRLADFGLARDLDDAQRLTRTGVLLGTPGFCAPEQLGGGGAVGPATDVYGAGATLYMALTGLAPMRGASASEVLLATAGRPPEPPSAHRPGIPRALEALCLRCLEKDPGRRPANGDALAAALEEVLGLRRATVRRRGRAARRRTALLVACGGAIAGLAALAGGLAWRRAHARADAEVAPVPSAPARVDDVATREAARAALARGWTALGHGERDAATAAADEALALERSVEALALRVHARPAGAAADADSAEALALGPAAPDALVARADVLRALDRRPEALVLLDRALELDPRHARGHRVRGTVLLDLGRNDEAEAALTRSLDLDDADGLTWHNRGGVRLLRGAYLLAVQDLSRAIDLLAEPFDALIGRGSTRAQLGEGRAALLDLDRAVALRPTSGQGYSVRGQVRMSSLQDAPGAIADLRRALELDAGAVNALGLAWYAIALLQTGESAEALRQADAALALDPDQSIALAVRGHAFMALGRPADAIEPLERALPQLQGPSGEEARAALELARREVASPGRPSLGGARAADLLKRALGRLSAGDVAGARAAADDALALDPQLAAAWAVRGTVRARQGDREGGEADVRRALALDPEHLAARSALAELLIGAGRRDEAIEELRLATTRSPREGGLWINYGTLLSGAQRYDEAIAAYDRAVALLPEVGAGWLRRGEVKNALRDFRGARQDLDQAVRLQPQDAESWHERGVARCGLDDYAGAREDFDRALLIDGKRAGTLESRGRVRAVALGDLSGGADDLLAAFELDPRTVDGRGVVRALLVAQRPREALALADRLARVTPDDPLLLSHRADAHARLGDPAAARADLERALPLYAPDDPNREAARRLLRDLDR